MNAIAFFRSNKYPLAIVLMWLLAFLIASPIGEFAVNDDWAYAKNVYDLVVNGKFVVDPWPAMNLISQTVFGSIICSVFGFSFTALRISIFLLSVCSSVTLFRLIKKLSGENEFTAFVLAATFLFNPIYMHLSMTYMTDVFFTSMLIFAINALVNYHTSARISYYIWFCIWCILAMLCRQQALVFALLIIPAAVRQNKYLWKKVLLALLPVFLCWLVSDKYRHHLTANHIGHNLQQMHHLLDYLKVAPLDKHLLQGADVLLVLGGILLPVSLVLIFLHGLQLTRSNILIFIFTTICAVLSTVSAFGIYPLGNISDIFEIGPRVIKGSHELLDGEYAKYMNRLYYIFAVISLSLLLFFASRNRGRMLMMQAGIADRLLFFLVAVAYMLFVAVSNAYFDRYALPLILLILLFVVPVEAKWSSITRYIVTTLLALVFLISAVENRDYFIWQKKRAEAINYLYRNGVTPDQIDGGFEYNGWVKKNNEYPSDTSKSWWWVVDDKYIVGATAEKNYSTDTILVYQRFIPFQNDTLFVLKRDE